MVKLKTLRAERNQKLIISDWTALPDATPSEGRSAWLIYRQELRDLPANITDINNPTWPKDPK